MHLTISLGEPYGRTPETPPRAEDPMHLTISLGEPYGDACYKLIAAIVADGARAG